MVIATLLVYRAQARRQLLDKYPSIAVEISAVRMDRLHQVQQGCRLVRLYQSGTTTDWLNNDNWELMQEKGSEAWPR